MFNDVLTSRQAVCLTVLFTIGTTIITFGAHNAAEDTWIPLTAAVLAALPLYWIYSRILALFNGRDFFEILSICFGSRAAKPVAFLFSLYALIRGVVALRQYTEITQITTLDSTPLLIVSLCVGLVCAFMMKKGLYILGKCSCLFFAILLLVSFSLSILSINVLNPENLSPVAVTPIGTLAFLFLRFFCAPFGDGLILLAALSRIRQKRVKGWVLPACAGGAGLLLIVTMIRNILILGGPSFADLYFPSYTAVSIINLFDFLQRLEVLNSGVSLLNVVVQTSVCAYAVCKGCAFLTRVRDARLFALPVSLFIAVLSAVLFSGTAQLIGFEGFHFLYSLPFQILPVCLWRIGRSKVKNGRLPGPAVNTEPPKDGVSPPDSSERQR